MTDNLTAASPVTHALCPTCYPAPVTGQTFIALCGFTKTFTGYRAIGDCLDCARIEAEYGGVEGGCPRCG
jgi:hypothetical protein